MRRFIFLAMIILFFLTIITGFVGANDNPGNGGMHVAISLLFIASAIAHVVINRKSFVRYFKRPVKA